MKMKKLLFFTLVCLLTLPAAIAQKATVKLSLGALPLRHIPVSLEWRTGERQSINVQAGYIIQRDAASLISTLTDQDLPQLILSGFTFTPEYRFYVLPFKTSEYLSGLYVGPMLRFQRLAAETKFPVQGVGVTLSGSANTFRGGAQLGFQWVIKDRFVIDWFILGITGNFVSYRGSIATDEPVLTVEDLEQGIADILGSTVDLSGLNIEGALQSYSARAANAGVGVRTGLSIGVAF